MASFVVGFAAIAGFAAIGTLLIALAVPLIRRRVKPNSRYGIRLPATFADEWVWYEANARSGRDLLVWGAVEIAVALLPPLVMLPPLSVQLTMTMGLIYVFANIIVLLIGTLVFAGVACSRAERLLKARRAAAH
jgi:uncharacterized membrane protein